MDLEEQLLKCFRLFGLGQQIDLSLATWRGLCPAGIASPYHAAQLGISQGELLVTPLQIAQVLQALA